MRVKNGAAHLDEATQTIYIIGGWDEKETQNTVWKYHIETNEYEFDDFLPQKVEGHAIVNIPGTSKILIFGGFDSLGVTDRIMEYDYKTRKS